MREPADNIASSVELRSFRYHSAFLPEYITTVGISYLLTRMLSGEVEWTANHPLALVAQALFWCLSFLLVMLTLFHRCRYCTVTLGPGGMQHTFLSDRRCAVPFAEVERLRESRGWFFGRRARILEIGLWGQGRLRVSDFIRGYDELKAALAEATGMQVESGAGGAWALARLKRRSADRERVFGPVRALDLVLRIPSRVICLLPVMFVDLMMLALLQQGLSSYRPDYRGLLAVFGGVISLLVSAVAARFIYYYLFSSVFLNRSISASS
jgi:hypothetical protein